MMPSLRASTASQSKRPSKEVKAFAGSGVRLGAYND
jgi:hypothetical protein